MEERQECFPPRSCAARTINPVVLLQGLVKNLGFLRFSSILIEKLKPSH